MVDMKYGVCNVCGCTDDNPCYNPNVGHCWWADESHTICSHCADKAIADDPETKHCINSNSDDGLADQMQEEYDELYNKILDGVDWEIEDLDRLLELHLDLNTRV